MICSITRRNLFLSVFIFEHSWLEILIEGYNYYETEIFVTGYSVYGIKHSSLN